MSQSAEFASILTDLENCQARLAGINWSTSSSEVLAGSSLSGDQQTYVFLLSALSACMTMPGIPHNMGHDMLYVCSSADDRQLLRQHLQKFYGITDEASLWEAMNHTFNGYDHWDTFRTFWAGYPEFDVNELNPEGQQSFTAAIAFAQELYAIVGNNGILAFDINERIGLCRRAYAAELISEELFWQAATSMLYRANAFYNNWGEYALACLSGAVYFMYRNSSGKAAEVQQFFNIQKGLIDGLTAEDGLWRQYSWPIYGAKNQKQYKLQAKDMIEMLPWWEGPAGCLVSDRIMVDGCKVGYMYREEPTGFNGQDSGWRFFSGDEDDDYANNPDNVGFYNLNSVANSDPQIIPFLSAPVNSAFGRDDERAFREEAYEL